MGSCKKCGKAIAENEQFCKPCNEQGINNLIQQHETEMKKINWSFWLGTIGAGLIAGATAKILRAKGINLGFFPAFILWYGTYWIIKLIIKIWSRFH